MAGTKAGGLKAAKTIKERHGEDYYKVLRSKNHAVTGFAANRELARIAGRRGGKISKRTKHEKQLD